MATPTRSNTTPKNSDAEATFFLLVLAAFMAVGGLAKWAEKNATVHAALDWLTFPLLRTWAEHSPGMDAFLRRSPLFTWLMIQAAMIVVPCFLAVGLYLLFTYDTRRLKRAARRQLYARRENARLNEMTDEMEAKEGKPKAGGSPKPGEAATDAERLKDVFGKQSPEEKNGKQASFSLWRWLLGIS